MTSREAAFGAYPVAVIEGVAIATVVLHHPNVDRVLGARDVSFQMPLPRLFWLHPPYWMPPSRPSEAAP